jgi:tetratricopeptide (TPR) repeat protein
LTHRWGERRWSSTFLARLRALFGGRQRAIPEQLPNLPARLRRGELAASYLAAERDGDHRRAAAAAVTAADRAIVEREWWGADAWAHRALWHFERAELTLQATRAARRIGELRTLAGDPGSARRYYAEAISEARDIGAEREEGLAALGLGRAELNLGNVTTARRLAQIAIDLLERCGAPAGEVIAARELRGEEKEVG